MTRWLSIASAICLGLALATNPATASPDTQEGTKPKAPAQSDTKGKAANKDRVDGNLESIDKAKNMLLVRVRPDENLRQVLVNSETTYSIQNKASSLDDFRSGRRVICEGQFNEKNQLVATRCDMRQPK